jgi:hypothetical protein
MRADEIKWRANARQRAQKRSLKLGEMNDVRCRLLRERGHLSLANTWATISPVDFLVRSTRGSRMPTALIVLLRSIGLICGGHRAVVLDNLALRQQLALLTRTVKRPPLRLTDRLFWILLARGWRDWRSALVVVQPDTVVRWHRQWLRRHWTRLSRRRHPGRPTTSSAIRALVST